MLRIRLIPGDLEERGDEEAERALRVIIDQPPPITSSFPFATRAKSAIISVTFMSLAALHVVS